MRATEVAAEPLLRRFVPPGGADGSRGLVAGARPMSSRGGERVLSLLAAPPFTADMYVRLHTVAVRMAQAADGIGLRDATGEPIVVCL